LRLDPRLFRSALLAAALVSFPALGDDEPPPSAPREAAPKFSFHVFVSDLEPVRDRDERKAELFYAAARAEWERKGFGARAELRGKDGRFRPYFDGDVWLEEGYAFARVFSGELRVGKLQRTFGLEDETFSGNLFSRNGVTRNPDWGAGFVGEKRFKWNELSYSLLYLGRNDHVAWEEDGRGVESDPAASLRDAVEARATYKLNQGLWSVTPGLSLETARIVREAARGEFRRTDAGVDLTATVGPLALRAQGFYRSGEAANSGNNESRLAYDNAWAGLFELRAEFPTVTYRYVYCEWRYRGADANERIHQPGVVWMPRKGIEATVELVARRFRDRTGARADNAVRFGLSVGF
jgi:hypothetical protein